MGTEFSLKLCAMIEEIKKAIITQVEGEIPYIKDFNFKMETNLIEDIGLDSLDVMEIVMSLENRLNVKLDNKKIVKIRTIRDLYDAFYD